jgi:long-subunit acyl-CoA synthetase (AMP-forming)
VALVEVDWRDTARVPDAEVTRDDVAEIIFTSGATAEPKGVSSRTATCWPTSCRSSARS